jgi:hypothetical protein
MPVFRHQAWGVAFAKGAPAEGAFSACTVEAIDLEPKVQVGKFVGSSGFLFITGLHTDPRKP